MRCAKTLHGERKIYTSSLTVTVPVKEKLDVEESCWPKPDPNNRMNASETKETVLHLQVTANDGIMEKKIA